MELNIWKIKRLGSPVGIFASAAVLVLILVVVLSRNRTPLSSGMSGLVALEFEVFGKVQGMYFLLAL